MLRLIGKVKLILKQQSIDKTKPVGWTKSPSGAFRAHHPKLLFYIREWRPQGDSNPCYRRERAVSWASRRWGPKAGRWYDAYGRTSSRGCIGDEKTC